MRQEICIPLVWPFSSCFCTFTLEPSKYTGQCDLSRMPTWPCHVLCSTLFKWFTDVSTNQGATLAPPGLTLHIPMREYMPLRVGGWRRVLLTPQHCFQANSPSFCKVPLSFGAHTQLPITVIYFPCVQFSSVTQSCPTLCSWPHELQHARPPCPTSIPRAHPNSCPLSRWCHPTISSSVVPFSSCPQSFPASGSFQMSQLFGSGGQSIRVSASTSDLPMNIQNWSPLGWTGWISLQSKGLTRVLSNNTVQKHQFFGAQLSL